MDVEGELLDTCVQELRYQVENRGPKRGFGPDLCNRDTCGIQVSTLNKVRQTLFRGIGLSVDLGLCVWVLFLVTRDDNAIQRQVRHLQVLPWNGERQDKLQVELSRVQEQTGE